MADLLSLAVADAAACLFDVEQRAKTVAAQVRLLVPLLVQSADIATESLDRLEAGRGLDADEQAKIRLRTMTTAAQIMRLHDEFIAYASSVNSAVKACSEAVEIRKRASEY